MVHTLESTDYSLNLAAKLNAQMSNMQAGFGAYAKTVKYHSLMMNLQQQRIDELENSNRKKDTIIGELEEARFRMAEEHEDTRARMSVAIQDLERRVNEMQQNTGTKLLIAPEQYYSNEVPHIVPVEL